MDIWLTGAGGFLGGCLVNRLLLSGTDSVVALTSRPAVLMSRYSGNGRFKALGPDADFNGDSVSEAVLINCAFPRNADGPGMASGLRYVSDVLVKAAEAGFKGVINVSSQSVYDSKRTEAANEESPLSPDTAYAVGKYASELLTAAICKTRYTNVRLASLIGPGFDQRITNRLVDTALAKKEISVKRNRQVFGFLDVEDAADGIIRLAGTDPGSWAPVYNLGSGAGYSLHEIAETIRQVLQTDFGITIRIHEEESEAVSNSSVDAGRLELDTGFRAGISLEDSIRRIAVEKMKQYGYSS